MDAGTRPDVVEQALAELRHRLPKDLVEGIRSWDRAMVVTLLEAAKGAATEQLRTLDASILASLLLAVRRGGGPTGSTHDERIEFLGKSAEERRHLIEVIGFLTDTLSLYIKSPTPRRRGTGLLRFLPSDPGDGDSA